MTSAQPAFPNHTISVMGYPGITPSFLNAPKVGEKDVLVSHGQAEVADVADVASDLLKEVVSRDLEVFANSGSKEERDQAYARILAAVSVVGIASKANTTFAAAAVAQEGSVNALLKEADPANVGRGWGADDLAAAANENFIKSRDYALSAASEMEKDPSFGDVLKRRGDGIASFFARLGSTAVSLTALAQRALDIPGLVRQSISNGLDRADQVVQDAFDRWHARAGQKIESLKEQAFDKAFSLAEAADRGLSAAGDAAQAAGSQVKETALGVRDTVIAIDRVATNKIARPLIQWISETAIPAIGDFFKEVKAEKSQAYQARAKPSRLAVSSFETSQGEDSKLLMDNFPNHNPSRHAP